MILLTTEVFLSVLNPHFPQKVREKILEVYAPVLNKYLDPFKLVEQIVFQGAFLELGDGDTYTKSYRICMIRWKH